MNVRRHAAIGLAALTGAVLVAACGSTSTVDRRRPRRRRARAAAPPPRRSRRATRPRTGDPLRGRVEPPLPVPPEAAPRASTPPTPTSRSPPPPAARARASLRPSAAPSTMGGSDAYLSAGPGHRQPGRPQHPDRRLGAGRQLQPRRDQQPQAERRRARPDLLRAPSPPGTTPTIAALNPGVTLPSHPDHPGPARPTPRVTRSSSPPSSAPPTPPGPAAPASGPRSTGRASPAS